MKAKDIGSVGGLLLVGIIAGCGAISTCASMDGEHNEAVVRQYAAEIYPSAMGFEIVSAKCAGYDSDGDGYVSCTVVLKAPDASITTEAFECAPMWETCRVAKAVVHR